MIERHPGVNRLRVFFALTGAIGLASCEQLTGPKPQAKPCVVDTVYYIPLYSRIGRLIDSARVEQRTDFCRR